MDLRNVIDLVWMAVILFWLVKWAVYSDWGVFLCRIGIHHDRTITVYGPRRGVSRCVRPRCKRVVEFDFMPDDGRID